MSAPIATHSHLAHHFESREQQLAAGKLGMWIFLVTEVLFFSGLFVAYAVYRSKHPEVFAFGSQFLSTPLGCLNTVVLLFSSLAIAFAVRAAQLQNRRQVLAWLAVTLGCAGFFLGVKSVEYSSKWHEGLLWAGSFSPTDDHSSILPALSILGIPFVLLVVFALVWLLVLSKRSVTQRYAAKVSVLLGAAFLVGTGSAAFLSTLNGHTTPLSHGADHASATHVPDLAGVFFSIYYLVTGVHALHVLIGIGVIFYVSVCYVRGSMTRHFSYLENVSLYWHLVDLIWIFLFPLLYLLPTELK